MSEFIDSSGNQSITEYRGSVKIHKQ